ncbi:MAG: T9SS C-terminal target domain-containing protein [Crocinitomicaceae bacterium]|nr:T9SS C-terminal target domain-containing protein [Crocinitomicaceae bacterium]
MQFIRNIKAGKFINSKISNCITTSFLFFSCLVFQIVFSQTISRSSIGSLGSSSNNDGITIQQSVGQPSLVNHVNVEGTGLRQGFQQPISFIEEQNELNVLLYPNPNQGEFSFIVEESTEIKLQYQLFDHQGKLIFQGTTDSNLLTPITIQQPTPGMYHLKVSDGTKNSSFKVNVIQ